MRRAADADDVLEAHRRVGEQDRDDGCAQRRRGANVAAAVRRRGMHEAIRDRQQHDRRDRLQVRDREKKRHGRGCRDTQHDRTGAAEDHRGAALRRR